MRIIYFLLIAFSSINATAQVYSNKEVGKKSKDLADSLKQSDYPYLLPIWGDKATKAGFSLPYSAGLSIQYVWQKSELTIDQLSIGFNNGPLYNLSEIVRFNKAISEASGINVRPDVWVLPFLNVYGVLAKAYPSTAVDFSVHLPDETGTWEQVAAFNTKANFEASSLGFGMTPTVGVGGGFLALDMNVTWNDIAELEKPAFAFIFGPRFGKSFKLKKPNSTFAFWAGAFRLKLNSGTTGSIRLDEVIDTNGLQAKVDAGLQAVGEKQEQVDTWWTGLTPLEQNNPVNRARYETANRALTAAGGFFNGLDYALNDENYNSVQYSLDKRPKNMWNLVMGMQYQYNKHWMIRMEYGFAGTRNQFIGGLQYRFGI